MATKINKKLSLRKREVPRMKPRHHCLIFNRHYLVITKTLLENKCVFGVLQFEIETFPQIILFTIALCWYFRQQKRLKKLNLKEKEIDRKIKELKKMKTTDQKDPFLDLIRLEAMRRGASENN